MRTCYAHAIQSSAARASSLTKRTPNISANARRPRTEPRWFDRPGPPRPVRCLHISASRDSARSRCVATLHKERYSIYRRTPLAPCLLVAFAWALLCFGGAALTGAAFGFVSFFAVCFAFARASHLASAALSAV